MTHSSLSSGSLRAGFERELRSCRTLIWGLFAGIVGMLSTVLVLSWESSNSTNDSMNQKVATLSTEVREVCAKNDAELRNLNSKYGDLRTEVLTTISSLATSIGSIQSTLEEIKIELRAMRDRPHEK